MNPLAVFKTAALNHSATLPCCIFNRLADRTRYRKCKLPPDCHRMFAEAYSVRTAHVRKHVLHDLRRAVVSVREQVPIDRQRNCWRSVPKTAADGQDVQARRNEVLRKGVA